MTAQVPPHATTGLLAPEPWVLSLERAHLERRRKGLPLSVAALRIENLQALQGAHPPPVLDWLLRDLRQGLARSEEVGPAACRWQDDLILLVLPGLGPAMAAGAIRELLAGIEAARGARPIAGQGLVLSFAAVDAAAYRSLQEAAAALALRDR